MDRGGALAGRIDNALAYIEATDDDDVRPHALQTAYDVLMDIADLNELTTAELASFISVLVPARSRILRRRQGVGNSGRGVLRLVSTQC